MTCQTFYLHKTGTVQVGVVFCAFVAEPATVTLAGTEATAVLLLESVTVRSPGAAGPLAAAFRSHEEAAAACR